MPKPVKKKAAKPKRPASDPNRRARQLMAEHLDKVQASSPPWDTPTPDAPPSFEEQYRARMAELGRKGGKASGAKRMEMPERQRKAIAKKAASARWGKKT